jgi:preprotein translocase subunit YajC
MQPLLLPLILIFFFFYVMVIRPQNRRMAEHRTMLNALAKGDKVVTGGGLLAEVVKLQGDDEVVLELADGVKVTALRNTIMMRRNHQDTHKTEKK